MADRRAFAAMATRIPEEVAKYERLAILANWPRFVELFAIAGVGTRGLGLEKLAC